MQILTTMITPYKNDGSIDFDTAEKYVDWYYENGLDGIMGDIHYGRSYVFLKLKWYLMKPGEKTVVLSRKFGHLWM